MGVWEAASPKNFADYNAQEDYFQEKQTKENLISRIKTPKSNLLK